MHRSAWGPREHAPANPAQSAQPTTMTQSAQLTSGTSSRTSPPINTIGETLVHKPGTHAPAEPCAAAPITHDAGAADEASSVRASGAPRHV